MDSDNVLNDTSYVCEESCVFFRSAIKLIELRKLSSYINRIKDKTHILRIIRFKMLGFCMLGRALILYI